MTTAITAANSIKRLLLSHIETSANSAQEREELVLQFVKGCIHDFIRQLLEFEIMCNFFLISLPGIHTLHYILHSKYNKSHSAH
jgi:hypothetical protein